MSLPYRYSKERTLKHLPKWRKPSPAMIVAIAALAVSLGGTAVAGPIAEISLNKGEKKQIRKITRNISNRVSNRRITQRAPGLAVASAAFSNIANVANAANTANNAKNAEDAENAEELDGIDADGFVRRPDLLWALVDEVGVLRDGSGAVTATRLGAGNFRVTFNRDIDGCITEGTATDVDGGAFPGGASARIIGTDNRAQANDATVDVSTTDPAGALVDPVSGDGFTVTVYC